jgi:uncharacterized SAM-binding protein YcdF (DUF218 family)
VRGALLHCGGNLDRAHTTAAHAVRLDSPVIISSEEHPDLVLRLLLDAGVPRGMIWFDYRPWDTVTHVHAVLAELVAAGVTHLHVVTDRFHLRRAVAIARILCHGTGITVVGLAHDDPAQAHRRDPLVRLLKDVLRAWWLRETGHLVYDRDIRLARFESLLLCRERVRALDPSLLLNNLSSRA